MSDLDILRRNSASVASSEAAGRHTREVPLPSRHWKTRILLPGVVLSAALGLMAYAARGALTPSVPVHIVPAVQKSGIAATSTAVVQAPGWVEPDPYPITVSSLTDGVVQEVLALEGSFVKKGDIVARLVRQDAQLAADRAAAELHERQAQEETAKALLNEAQQNWDYPLELQRRVATAEAIVAEKRAALARWPADQQAAQSLLAELKADYELQKGLQADNLSAKIKFVRSQFQYQAQEAVLKGLEQERLVREAQVKAAEAEVTAAQRAIELRIPESRALAEAKSRLKEVGASLERAKVQQREADLRLSRMDVRAPADGVVMVRLVQPGNALMLNSPSGGSSEVMRLHTPDKLQVRVDVPLADAAHVGLAQDAEIVVNVLPDHIFKGHVSRIVHEADIQKNTLQVKVAIHDPSPELKPEMLARVKFLAVASTQPSAQVSFFVPKELVSEKGGHAQLWIVDGTRNVAERRDVIVGATQMDGWVQIQEGLRAGDRLIADPPADLKPGTAVRVLGEAISHKEGH